MQKDLYLQMKHQYLRYCHPVIHLIFVIVALLCTSCRAYRIYPEQYRYFNNSTVQKKAVVLNPQLAKEYDILKNAAIFNLVEDSTLPGIVKIKLVPMRKRLACGNGALVSLFTAAQVPVIYPDRFLYTIEERTGDITVEKQFELLVATIVWFWNIFSTKKIFNKQAGQALAASYHHP